MKELSPKGQKVNQRKARTRRAHGGTPSANRSGRRKERAMETKVAKEKEKGSQNPQTGRRTGLSRIQRGFPFAGIISIKKTCQGQCGRSHNCPVVNAEGWVCNAGPKEHKPENCPTAPSAAVPRARLGAFGLTVRGLSGAPPVPGGLLPQTVVDACVPAAPISSWMPLPPSWFPGCSTAPLAAV